MSDGMIFLFVSLTRGGKEKPAWVSQPPVTPNLSFIWGSDPPILEMKMRYLEIFAGQWFSGAVLLDGCRDWGCLLVAFGLIAFVCAKLVSSQHACVIWALLCRKEVGEIDQEAKWMYVSPERGQGMLQTNLNGAFRRCVFVYIYGLRANGLLI